MPVWGVGRRADGGRKGGVRAEHAGDLTSDPLLVYVLNPPLVQSVSTACTCSIAHSASSDVADMSPSIA